MEQTRESDRRQRAPFPQQLQDGDENDLVTRDEAAELAGVDPRTVTRWAAAGYLTKFENARGSVRFSRRQAVAMNRFDPVVPEG